MAKLAINGATPTLEAETPIWPRWTEEERECLSATLDAGVWGTLGPEAVSFAERFAAYQQAEFGVAVANGTVSLELILEALGIGRGDEVIVPSYTFVATAAAVVRVGATPIFADIEEETCNIAVESVRSQVSDATRAVVVVHIGGRPCDMDALTELCSTRGLWLVEDAAHAHGSEWRGKRVGALGDAGSFSFQASKNLSAGEGGFVCTKTRELYETVWSLHHCGRAYDRDDWYTYTTIGTNARMTEWQAAILNVQLSRADEQIDLRTRNATLLSSMLESIDGVRPMALDNRVTRNSNFLYLFHYQSEEFSDVEKATFLEALRAEGVRCAKGYSALHREAAFTSETFRRRTGRDVDYSATMLPNTDRAFSQGIIWIPGRVLLGSTSYIEKVGEAIAKISENCNELRV